MSVRYSVGILSRKNSAGQGPVARQHRPESKAEG